MSDCTGCRNAQVLFMLTELLWDDKSLLDVTGCQKTQVSDCTGSIVYIKRSKYCVTFTVNNMIMRQLERQPK